MTNEVQDVQEMQEYPTIKAIQEKINKKNTNIENQEKYRNELKSKLQIQPQEFYIDFLVDLRMMIDNAKANPETKPKEILSMEESFLKAWSELAKLRFVSADTKAKLLKDDKNKANPDKLKEIYGTN